VLSLKEKILLIGLGLANLTLVANATSSDTANEICQFRHQEKIISVRERKYFELPLVSGTFSGRWVVETTRATLDTNWSLISNEIIATDNQYSKYRSSSRNNDYNGPECIRLAGLPHDYDPSINKSSSGQSESQVKEATVEPTTRADEPTTPSNPYAQFASSFGRSHGKPIYTSVTVDKQAKNPNGESLLFFFLKEERDANLALEWLNQNFSSDAISRDFEVTPLMLASGNSTPEVLRIILERNQNQIDFQTSQGATALMYAASAGRADNVRALLAAGANKNLRDRNGDDAEAMARQQSYFSIAQIISSAN
jgi:Ankyrin repeats (3 copies)